MAASSTRLPHNDLDHAYIELGGFRIGKTNLLFDTFTGSAGDVINDGIVPYAPGGTHQICLHLHGWQRLHRDGCP